MFKPFKNLKLTSRRVFRTMMVFILFLTLATAALMILDQNTNFHETTIDIIVLLIGVVALIMAVLTEAELERNARRSSELHKEVLLALEEIRELNKDNEYLKRKIQEETRLDKEISKKLDDIAK